MPTLPTTPATPIVDHERWIQEASGVEETENPLNIPYDVAIKEATQAASFVIRYWDPDGDRPGLARVGKRLPLQTATDILSLVRTVQQAQTELLLLVDPLVQDLGERARFVVAELESALGFLLDDDVDEPEDAQLARIKEFHSQDGERSSALAQALRDYASLAKSLEARLVEVDSEFDPDLIREAHEIADKLSLQPTAAAPTSSAVRTATTTRNRLLRLLMGKVGAVRKTSAHVFRRHPEIVRQATSAYQRRRSAARRNKAAREAEAARKAGETKAGDP